MRQRTAITEMRKSLLNEIGISLVEILTVLAIVTVMVGLAVPSILSWLNKYRVDSATREVTYNLMLARSRAVSNNNDVIVTFVSGAGSFKYEVHDDTNSNGIRESGEAIKVVYLEDPIEFGGNLGVMNIQGSPIPSNGLILGADSQIVFDSKGMASESGSVYLIPRIDYDSRNDRMRAVSILQSTGNVESWRYAEDASPWPWEL